MSIFGKVARGVAVGAASLLLGGTAMSQEHVVIIVTSPYHAPAYMAPSAKEVGVRRYATHRNYCPAGLRPVSVDGSFGCGTPNRYQSYQQAMKHPAQRARRHAVRGYSARPDCPEGAKGCY